jgi:peptidyl-prolyl cis-trans isomerase SurA
MRKYLSIATLLISTLPIIPTIVHAELRDLDRIVAIVNEDVIMASELEAQITALSRQYLRNQNQLPPRDQVLPQVLDKLIQDRLQLEVGQRVGVKVSDAELREALIDTAKQQKLTLDQFAAQAREDGFTLAQLRYQFRNEMIIARVQQGMVMQRIEISEQEIDNFLNSEEGEFMSSPEVNVGHILLRLPTNADENVASSTFKKIAELKNLAAQGNDFRNIALLNSAGPNALNGGDLGWKKAVQLPALFTRAIDSLKPGEVSDPLRSDAGVHLLKLYERRGGGEQLIAQNEVRHILLKSNEIRSKEATGQLAADLRARILAGEKFADLAREYSEDTGTALKGGDLGWSVPGQFVDNFEKTVNQLEIGVISEPLLTQFGWHLIEVTGRRKQDFSVRILRNRASNLLQQRRYTEELQVWLEEIRSEAFIDIKS